MTISTADRKCILGEIVDGRMVTSEIGRIVEMCWREIPDHFPNARTGAFQVMPDHVHGIIDIRRRASPRTKPEPPVGGEYIHPLQEPGGRESRRCPANTFQHVPIGSLPSIVRSFKAAVTREARGGLGIRGSIWQRSFHDHIIRDGRDQYFIEQYITLNPLIWHLEQRRTAGETVDPETLRRQLKEQTGLDDFAIELIIEHHAG